MNTKQHNRIFNKLSSPEDAKRRSFLERLLESGRRFSKHELALADAALDHEVKLTPQQRNWIDGLIKTYGKDPRK